jgi:hypothetical protein
MFFDKPFYFFKFSEYKTNYDLKSLHILNEQLQIKDRQITELHTIIKEIVDKD